MVSAVSSALAAPTHDGSAQDPPRTFQRPEHSCGTRQVRPTAHPFVEPLPAGTQRTIYLNKNGGTYTIGGSTNSATNTASNNVVQGNGITTVTIPPLASGFDWARIAACVKTHFQPYNIRVVETEPTTGMYTEAVVGGFGSELGFGENQLFGIASADNFCGVTERGIAFNFSETHRNVPRKDDELCATIAHEVGHLLALEHETLAADVMSYVLIANSNTKSFINQSSACGTAPGQEVNCSCGGGSTNSAARLTQFIGLRSTETVPPMLTVDAPGGLELPPTFDVVTTATDNEAMADVTILIDNIEIGVDEEAENNVYKVTAKNVAEGNHALRIVARDQAGNITAKDLAITVAKLATGETCVSNDVCVGGLCAMAGTGSFCTQVCELANDACPDGFACSDVGGTAVCVATEDTGCGCTSNDANPGAIAMLVLGIGLVLSRKRRRG